VYLLPSGSLVVLISRGSDFLSAVSLYNWKLHMVPQLSEAQHFLTGCCSSQLLLAMAQPNNSNQAGRPHSPPRRFLSCKRAAFPIVQRCNPLHLFPGFKSLELQPFFLGSVHPIVISRCFCLCLQGLPLFSMNSRLFFRSWKCYLHCLSAKDPANKPSRFSPAFGL
jgi:hypothetical protein